MKNIAKILCFVLSLVLVFSVMAVSAFAEGEAAVAKIGDVEYTSLADALDAAEYGQTITLLSDVEESITAFTGVTLESGVEGGVKVTVTYADNYVDFDDVTLGAGVTLNIPNVYSGGSSNTVLGTLNVGEIYYHGYDATTVIKDGGRVTVGNTTILRYNETAEAGIYVYGDGDNSTVEFDCDYYVGAYTGTFYAENANVECGYFLLKNSYDADKGYTNSVALNLKASTLSVAGTTDGQDSFITDGAASITLASGSSIKDVRDFNILAGANLELNLSSNSSIVATNVNIAEELADTIKTSENADGSHKVFIPTAKIGDNYYQTLADAVNACVAGDNIITLVADCGETVTIKQQAGKNIVIDGAGYTYTGSFKLNGNKRWNGAETLTIKNVNFYTEKASHDFITYAVKASYVHNLTVDSCTFTGTEAQTAVRCIVLRQANKVTVKNCTATNVFNLVQNASGATSITVDGCTVDAMYGINLGNAGGNNSVSNSTINASVGYAVNMSGGNKGATTLDTVTVENGFIRVDNSTTTDYVLTIEGENVIPVINTLGTGNVEIALEDDMNLSENADGSFGVVYKDETPYIGENGNWWIGNVDTGYKAVPSIEIVDGYWYINGQPALDAEGNPIRAEGTDGHTPKVSIGEDGYWYIDGVKTENRAEALPGVGIEKIEKNEALSDDYSTSYVIYFTNGDKFTFTVTNGVNGSQGLPGLQGPEGEKGEKGDQGAPGLDGDNGDSVVKIVSVAAGVAVLLALIVLGCRVFKRDPFKLIL